MDQEYGTTRLSDIGEKQLVKLILNTLSPSNLIVGGRGNDATAVDLGFGSLLAVTVDRCPTPLAYKINPHNVGVWGSLAITCVASDLLASGAEPAAFLTSILSPRDLKVVGLMDLVKRADAQAKAVGAEIVAGDTKESSQLNVVTVGIGTFANGRHIPRTGAKAGDVLILTGNIGNFTAAHIAHRKGIALTALDATLSDSVLHPKPAYEVAVSLLRQIQPRAGMDLSDGLLGTIFRLSELNHLGFVLRESAIPMSSAAICFAQKFGIDPLRLAVGTGDWQIGYVVDHDEWEQLPANSREQVHNVGEFTADPGIRLRTVAGTIQELILLEQEHFVRSSADADLLECLLKAPLFR